MPTNKLTILEFHTDKATMGEFETSWSFKGRKDANKSLIESIWIADNLEDPMDFLHPVVAKAVSELGISEVKARLVAIAQTTEDMARVAAGLTNGAVLAARIVRKIEREANAPKAKTPTKAKAPAARKKPAPAKAASKKTARRKPAAVKAA